MAPSIDLDSPNPAIVTSKRSSHPLAPLDANEIASAASLVQQQWPPGTDIHFKVVTLQEPPKAQMIPLIEAENSGKTFRAPNRIVYLTYYIRNTVSCFNISVCCDPAVSYNVGPCTVLLPHEIDSGRFCTLQIDYANIHAVVAIQ